MALPLTLALLLVGIGCAGLGLWSERRPHEIGALRLPSTLLLMIGIVLVVLMAAHLVTTLTGRDFTGRRGY